MSLGFLGPSYGQVDRLRDLSEMLLFSVGVDRVIYLGPDDGLDRAVPGWAERLGAPDDDAHFLTEAALLAPDAPADALEALLERDARRHRLADLAALADASDRCVEMIEDRMVLMVYDKAVLDEDDIANATIVVYGRAHRPDLRAIGPRAFLTPGPLISEGGAQVGVVELKDDALLVSLRDRKGAVVQEVRLPLHQASLKVDLRSPC